MTDPATDGPPDDRPRDETATSPRETGGSSRAGGSGLGGPLGDLGGVLGPPDDPPDDSPPDGPDDGPDVTAAAAGVLRDQATAWFEPLYRDADGNPAVVPWARLEPEPLVHAWLDQPGLDVAGVDVVVVGCGLGDDAAELARRGCRVTAFDVSPTAVDWARDRFPDLSVDTPTAGRITWEVADVLDLPDHLVGAFGLVVEVRTVQSLPGTVRDDAMLGIASLVGPGGYLVATTLVATSDEAASRVQGPPWAQAPAELAAYRAGGLERVSLDHPPEPAGDAMAVRLVFHRRVPPT